MIEIAHATPADEADWTRLWSAYVRFYKSHVPDGVTRATWRRILDEGHVFRCYIARDSERDGRAVGFDTWEQEFKQVDIIISSTAAPHYVLTRDKLEGLLRQRGHRPLLLVDIAVPRDIDPDCNQLENVYVYNIDDLQGIAGQYLEQRKAELELCKRLIAKKRNELLDSLQAHPGNTNHGLREQQAGS